MGHSGTEALYQTKFRNVDRSSPPGLSLRTGRSVSIHLLFQQGILLHERSWEGVGVLRGACIFGVRSRKLHNVVEIRLRKGFGESHDGIGQIPMFDVD